MGMPTHVQDLLVEVDLVRVCLLAHALRTASGRARTATLLAVLTSAGVHGRRDTDLLGFEGALVSLKDDFGVLVRIAGVDHEVVVVGASHNVPRITREGDLKLVENAVVLICVAESRAEVLVDGDGLDWLTFHVDVPDLDREVVTREDVAAVMTETDVGDGRDNFREE